MLHFLYILRSLKQKRYYIGITNSTDERVKEHNSGSVRSTKGYRPWVKIYEESFFDKTEARKREIFLKKNYQARNEIFEKFGIV